MEGANMHYDDQLSSHENEEYEDDYGEEVMNGDTGRGNQEGGNNGGFQGFEDGEDEAEEIVSQNSVLDLSSHQDDGGSYFSGAQQAIANHQQYTGGFYNQVANNPDFSQNNYINQSSSLLDAAHLIMPPGQAVHTGLSQADISNINPTTDDDQTMIKPRNLDYYQHDYQRELNQHMLQAQQLYQAVDKIDHSHDYEDSQEDRDEEGPSHSVRQEQAWEESAEGGSPHKKHHGHQPHFGGIQQMRGNQNSQGPLEDVEEDEGNEEGQEYEEDDENDDGHQSQEYERHDEDDEDNQSEEEQDQVNEMSFHYNLGGGGNYYRFPQDQQKQQLQQQQNLIEEELGSSDNDNQHASEDDRSAAQLAYQQYQVYKHQQHQLQQENCDQESNEEEEESDDQDVGEMKAKFDKILATFVEDKGTPAAPQQNQGVFKVNQNALQGKSIQNEGSEGINDFKNKNMQNNMKGLMMNQASGSDNEDENENEEPEESPAAVYEPIGENDHSLNIQINKKKMFAKPPMIPIRQSSDQANNDFIQRAALQQKAQTPDNVDDPLNRQSMNPRYGQLSGGGNHIKQNRTQLQGQRSNSHRPLSQENINCNVAVQARGTGGQVPTHQRPKSAKIAPQARQQQHQQPCVQSQQQRPGTANSHSNIHIKHQLVSHNLKSQQQPQQNEQDENTNMLNQRPIALGVPRKPLVPKQLHAVIQQQAQQQVAAQQPLKRPMTANPKLASNNRGLAVISTPIINGAKKAGLGSAKKKSDPVKSFQALQNFRKSNSFLKSSDTKQGRKLELDRFHKWSSLVHAHNQQATIKKSNIHKVVPQGKAPTEDRRDDLRFQLRAKISQKDYVDKQMKDFHYNKEILQNGAAAGARTQQYVMNMNAANLAVAQQSAMINTGEDKLEQLKKQIDHLKRCIN